MKPQPTYFFIGRICLIVVIVASAVVCAANLTKLRQRITDLQTDLKMSRAAQEKTAAELAQTKTTLQGALSTLKETKSALEVSNSERDRAMAQAASETKRSQELGQTLKKTKQELAETKDHLARYTNIGLTPEQVVAAAQKIRELQVRAETFEAENGLLTRKIRTLFEQQSPDTSVPLPANLTTKVTITDPKWRFVVLDAGSEKGMLERGELLVSRNGKLLGKVKVSHVEKDRSFANLCPGWDLAELQEGDIAIPANPDSSGIASRN